MYDLGAYFQCCNNPKATENVLKNFRKVYPDSDIVLLSDGGLNFSDIAAKYNCIYIHSPINIGLNKLTIDTGLEVFKRLSAAARFITQPAFMLLEDDVLVRDKIDYTKSMIPLNADLYDFVGSYTGNMLGDEVCQYLGWPLGRLQYGGCGGSILDRNFVQNYFHIYYYDICKFLRDFTGDNGFTDNRLKSIDYMITCFVYICGGLYGPLQGFAECTHHPDWRDEQKYQVIHQYKEFY